MWNEEKCCLNVSEKHKQKQGQQKLCFGPSDQETVAGITTYFSCRLQKTLLQPTHMQDCCQGEVGGTSQHMDVLVWREQSCSVWCYFWDLTLSEVKSLNEVIMTKPLFGKIYFSGCGKLKHITSGKIYFGNCSNTNWYNLVLHRRHYVQCICKLIALFSALWTELSVSKIFPSFFFFVCTMTPYNWLSSNYWLN